MRRWVLLTWLLVSCKSAPSDRAASSEPPAASTAPVAMQSAQPHRSVDPSVAIARENDAASPILPDGSAPACRALRGPIELPLRAPATLALRGNTLDVILNDDGRPRAVSLLTGSASRSPLPVGREAAEEEPRSGLVVPCASAADRVFCPDRSGAVHRTTSGREEDRVVASSRPSSRIASASLGDAHAALGYLASRQTSEGWVSEAWLAVDDGPPRRISEDGSGATSLALVPKGGGALALMVDARTALTAMHVRPVAYDGALRVGEDVVVFVGGPGDRRTRGALAAQSSGPAWALLPIARDVASFGLAIVRLDDPPRVDEPVLWSMYPNGLDPAPLAVAWDAARGSRPWIARVRPRTADGSSPRVLELGELVGDGSFVPRDAVPTTGNPTDTSLVVDPLGTLWLGWLDDGGSWVERLACR
jgi:hypothetical protein